MKPMPFASVTRNIFSFLLVLISVSLAASEAMAADTVPQNETWPQYVDRVYFSIFAEPLNEYGGPLCNAGGASSEALKPLQNCTVIRKALNKSSYGVARISANSTKGYQAMRTLANQLQKGGGTLATYGQGATWHTPSGNAFDNLANVSAGLGAASAGDNVGVVHAGVNAYLSGLAATGGGAIGGAAGSFLLGTAVGGPVGGVIGGVGGAIGGSYAYQAVVEPRLKSAAQAVSNELQRQEEQADKVIRRAETDRILLERSGRLVNPLGPSSPSLSGGELFAFKPNRQADLTRQYDEIHQYAEEIRAEQMVARVQKNSIDNIGDRVDLLRTMRLKTGDPEAREKLAREIALLEQRLEQLPQADVTRRLYALNSMRDKTDDPAAREKIDREIAFLHQRDRKTADAAIKATAPTAVTTKTPPPPCPGLNEERNSAGVCVCRPGTEAVGGICRPYCAANMTRDGNGTCVCASGYEPLGGACVLKCQPNEERVGGICLTRCGLNEERSAQNICVCIPGFVPTPKGCAPACGPNETRDEAGKCVCSAGFEKVNGECVPFCAQGEVRAEGGNCVKGYTCGTDSDCPAGFSCSPAGMCVDNRPSGEAAVRMRTEVNQDQRSQTGRSQLPLYGQTTTRPERFGLGQMPGGPTQVLTPLVGAGPTSTQQQAGTTTTPTTPTTPSDIACGAGGKCPSGYTCNSRTGVCVKQAQATGTVTNIPTCTTDRDCPGAKCVNNVCTSAPPASGTTIQPASGPTSGTSTQPSGSWYLYEYAFTYTDLQSRRRCTSTNRSAVPFDKPADAQAFLRTLGDEVMRTVRGTYPDAALVSTRMVSGPTQAKPALPAGGQGGVVSVRCQ